MVLSNREKAVSIISNAISAYSIYTQKGTLPDNQSLIDFILKAAPDELKPEITMDLIDEVFDYVSKTHDIS
ncbi:MAG TPA: hypothetical protein VH562_01415 [Nitrosopumilaceae archaeon]|jgi:hypothetical protein